MHYQLPEFLDESDYLDPSQFDFQRKNVWANKLRKELDRVNMSPLSLGGF